MLGNHDPVAPGTLPGHAAAEWQEGPIAFRHIAWMGRLLDRNAAIAAAEGFALQPEALQQIRPMFENPKAKNQASMLHDLEAGGRIEADHILGFMLEAARRAGVEDALHETAYIHAKAFENRRDAGRLGRGG